MIYKTNALQQASYLKANDNDLLYVENELGKVIFCFDDSPKLKKDIDDFFNNKPVKNQDFWQAIKSMKSLVYQSR